MIDAGTILDGRGGMLHNQQIVIENGRIVSVAAGSAKADYDLRTLTVMPGWIDTHIHLNWHIDATTSPSPAAASRRTWRSTPRPMHG